MIHSGLKKLSEVEVNRRALESEIFVWKGFKKLIYPTSVLELIEEDDHMMCALLLFSGSNPRRASTNEWPATARDAFLEPRVNPVVSTPSVRQPAGAGAGPASEQRCCVGTPTQNLEHAK